MHDCCPCECGTEACKDPHEVNTHDDNECIQFKWGQEFTCQDAIEYCNDPEFAETVQDCCPITC